MRLTVRSAVGSKADQEARRSRTAFSSRWDRFECRRKTAQTGKFTAIHTVGRPSTNVIACPTQHVTDHLYTQLGTT